VKLFIGLLATIAIVVMLALAIYIAIDAKRNIDRYLEYREIYRRAINCTATETESCTGATPANIYVCALELIAGIVKIAASAALMIIALIAAAAFAKLFAELGRYGY
jgi:hypothetical protein